MVNLANNSLFKASETKFYLKIDRLLIKVCLDFSTQMSSFVIDCINNLEINNFDDFVIKKRKFMSLNEVEYMISFLTQRLSLNKKRTLKKVLSYIDCRFLFEEKSKREHLIEKLFEDNPLVGKLILVWFFVDNLLLARFSMPLTSMENKILKYISLIGDYKMACAKYKLSDFESNYLLEGLYYKASTRNLDYIKFVYLITSYQPMEMSKEIIFCINYECYKIYSKLKGIKDTNIKDIILLESALEYSYNILENKTEKIHYLKSAQKLMKQCRPDFLAILDDTKTLTKKEVIARYFEKIDSLYYFSKKYNY